jgi:hypothetical protein
VIIQKNFSIDYSSEEDALAQIAFERETIPLTLCGSQNITMMVSE